MKICFCLVRVFLFAELHVMSMNNSQNMLFAELTKKENQALAKWKSEKDGRLAAENTTPTSKDAPAELTYSLSNVFEPEVQDPGEFEHRPGVDMATKQKGDSDLHYGGTGYIPTGGWNHSLR